ncbi:hypothetical protein ABID49_002473 [Bhargavaea ullalensis]|uniref:Uncharacterized protein n=1 Tax=Bhargavaea ullalensis TaxID=1265685 RepID=A0ABV2GE22_9BACL
MFELSLLADSNANCRPAMVEPGGNIHSSELYPERIVRILP